MQSNGVQSTLAELHRTKFVEPDWIEFEWSRKQERIESEWNEAKRNENWIEPNRTEPNRTEPIWTPIHDLDTKCMIIQSIRTQPNPTQLIPSPPNPTQPNRLVPNRIESNRTEPKRIESNWIEKFNRTESLHQEYKQKKRNLIGGEQDYMQKVRMVSKAKGEEREGGGAGGAPAGGGGGRRKSSGKRTAHADEGIAKPFLFLICYRFSFFFYPLCTFPLELLGFRAFSTSFLTLFRTAVPFWGQTTWTLSRLSPKRDCGSKRG